MALFQRTTQTNSIPQYYTIAQQRSILLIGLGNIGKKYEGTRHNIGFLCIDAFVNTRQELGAWQTKSDLKCELATGQMGDTRVIVMKPTTFMNLSGEAVQAVSHYYKIEPDHIVVVHDELDIPFGQIRLRTGGGSAGHNGIKSISSLIGENYGRIRIGIGPKYPEEMDSADFVLQRFEDNEKQQLKLLSQEVVSILSEYVYSGQLLNETRNFIV